MKILSLFDNIKLPVKMSIIGVLAIAGLALPTYYYASLSLEQQAATRLEIKGITPASEIVKLKKVIAEHRGMSAKFFGGDSSSASSLRAKGNEVNQRFEQVSQVLSQSELDSSRLQNFQSIENQWSSLRSQVDARSLNAPESFLEHSQLLIELDLYIGEISNFYGLSYDPSPMGSHLIIANFQNMPRLADGLGKIRGAGAGALSGEQISPASKSVIRAYINSVTVPLQDYAYNMQEAAKADSRLSNAARQATDFENDVNQLITLTESEILNRDVPIFSGNEFFTQFSNSLATLYQQHDENVRSLRRNLDERADSNSATRNTTLTILAVVFLFGAAIAIIIIRSLQSSTSKLIGTFKQISHGEYDIEFNVNREDEIGILEKELASLTEKLKDSAVVAQEASKVKQALDSCSTPFMMSNSDREIVYMNESVYELLKRAESDIRKDLPQFNVETLIGTRIDSFHHNPAHQHAVLDGLKSVHEARLDLGGYSFRLMINPIRDEDGNDLGNSVEWHDMTEVYEEERRVTRILEALDCASTNVMIADADRNIIYLNKSVQEMLKEAESDLRKVLPHFSASDIFGQNMDVFHKNPKHQESLLDGLRDAHQSQINVGTRVFRLIANPIMDNRGNRIGTVVEWLDRTKEVAAEKEIAEIVQASLEGDFKKRVTEEGKEGFLLSMAQGLNQLMGTTEAGLNEVSKVLLAISEGDLTKRIDADFKGTFDALKTYCNTTSDNLANVISKIREASDTINNAATEIASGNSDLSTRTEQQASSLEETASSMEELTSTVRLNAENANQANGLASKASEVASNGGELIKEVVVTMASINESAQKISDIIGVIDGIAFQTNILALNAAVEAARAGEQGRGFAVVASEVRTLAQRSANAAKDIKDLISDSVTKVESGNELVNQSGETMQEIVVAIKRVNDIMSEIAAASAEQASGIDEVSKAVSQMDEMTQQNAALVEEAAAAAESMRGQAGELTTRVGTFKLNQSDVKTSMAKSSPDMLSQQFEELPSVGENSKQSSGRDIPMISEEDEWESF